MPCERRLFYRFMTPLFGIVRARLVPARQPPPIMRCARTSARRAESASMNRYGNLAQRKSGKNMEVIVG